MQMHSIYTHPKSAMYLISPISRWELEAIEHGQIQLLKP